MGSPEPEEGFATTPEAEEPTFMPMLIPLMEPPTHVLDATEISGDDAWRIICDSEWANTHRSTGLGKRDDGNVLEWILECRMRGYSSATKELKMANWQYPGEATWPKL